MYVPWKAVGQISLAERKYEKHLVINIKLLLTVSIQCKGDGLEETKSPT